MGRGRSTILAKRYAELADALDEMALHYRLDDRGRLSRDYQRSASALRTMEFIPPNPAEADGIAVPVRDSIAEWRAFGEINELTNMREERPYLSNLTAIAKVGPKTADTIHEEKGATDIGDIRELADNGELEDISGIGPKTATTIRRSIAQLE